MNTTKAVKERRRQSPEEMVAGFRRMVEFQKWLEEGYRRGFIPSGHLLQPFDPKTLTSKNLLHWYNQKARKWRPKKRRGPKKKEPRGDPLLPKQNRRALRPELADLAFTMDDRGAHWRDIAKACYPDKKPADLLTNAMRKHVDRLIENGAIRSRLRQKTRTE